MVSYRRNLVPGGSYFFTVNLAERRLGLLTENIGLLRTAEAPKVSAAFGSGDIGSIRCVTKTTLPAISITFTFNSVKHGYTPRVEDWPYSSFRRWVRLGASPDDWAGDTGDDLRAFGER